MPDWDKEIGDRLESLKISPSDETSIVEEIAQHLEDRYQEMMANGDTQESAHREVLRELDDGKFTAEIRASISAKVETSPAGLDEDEKLLAGLWKDLLYGARLLRANPGFTAVAILSLALGIGANTAVFQLLDAVRLRTLPVRDPQQLADVAVVYHPNGRTGDFTSTHPDLTYALWQQIRDQGQAFSSIAAWSSQPLNLNQGGEARYADALWVSGSFFDTLGIRPVVGRLISTSDDRAGCGVGGVVISDSFWQKEFAANPSVLGRKINLEGHPFEIIGVTSPSFFGVEVGRRFDVALPICSEAVTTGPNPRINDPKAWWLAAIGRLKPGWTTARTSAQLAAISPGIFEATLPPDYDAQDRKDYLRFRLGSRPVGTGTSQLRKDYESPLWLLLAISALVLLIACANLANLLLARASARQRELAVRLALGASSARLTRQLLAESSLLAVLGALCGAGVARVLSHLLVSFLSTERTRLFVDLNLDWRVLAFTAALAVLTCLLFGLAPAIQASRTPPAEVLKATGRGLTTGRGRFRLRRALVISQVALSFVLLVGALLFIRTLSNLANLDAGFQRDHILVAALDLSPLNLPVARRISYKDEVLARVRSVPGVSSAAAASIVPLSGQGWNDNINIPGSQIQRQLANFNRVTPGYFRTMGTPLLMGRDFSEGDNASSPAVAIVTQTFARKYLNGSNPIGRTFSLIRGSKPEKLFQIVGLVKDTKYGDLREDFSPVVFLAKGQDGDPNLDLRIVIRSDEPLIDLVPAVKHAITTMDRAIVIDFSVLKTRIRESLLRERLMALLAGFFGILAAVLAMIGLYGVVSYMVARRRNEIGVRVALGANPRQIVGMILGESASLLGIGLGIGLVLAIAAGSAARALLFGLRPSDPTTLAFALASLAAIALAASLLPAQRAAGLDPMTALHDE
jgi:putative ABC transport system permease protein